MVTAMALATDKLRRAKIPSGTKGWAATRASMTKKAANITTPRARATSVGAEPQGWTSVPTIPYTRMARPPVTVSAPGRSRERMAVLARDSFTASAVTTMSTTPMGTFMNSTQRQFRALVSTPPSRTPMAAPLAAVADQAPSARRRLSASTKLLVRRLNVAGASTAPPRP